MSNKNNFNISVNPNPFNQQASVFFSIPQQSNVMISLYNLNWEKVKTVLNEKQNAGFHYFNIIFPELNPGIYFLEVRTDNFYEIKKIIH